MLVAVAVLINDRMLRAADGATDDADDWTLCCCCCRCDDDDDDDEWCGCCSALDVGALPAAVAVPQSLPSGKDRRSTEGCLVRRMRRRILSVSLVPDEEEEAGPLVEADEEERISGGGVAVCAGGSAMVVVVLLVLVLVLWWDDRVNNGGRTAGSASVPLVGVWMGGIGGARGLKQ